MGALQKQVGLGQSEKAKIKCFDLKKQTKVWWRGKKEREPIWYGRKSILALKPPGISITCCVLTKSSTLLSQLLVSKLFQSYRTLSFVCQSRCEFVSGFRCLFFYYLLLNQKSEMHWLEKKMIPTKKERLLSGRRRRRRRKYCFSVFLENEITLLFWKSIILGETVSLKKKNLKLPRHPGWWWREALNPKTEMSQWCHLESKCSIMLVWGLSILGILFVPGGPKIQSDCRK